MNGSPLISNGYVAPLLSCDGPLIMTHFAGCSMKNGCERATSSFVGTTTSLREKPFLSLSTTRTRVFTAYFPGGSESVA